MVNYRSDKKYAWLAAILAFMVAAAIAGPEVILSPGKYLFETHGDHIKNYYVAAYFVKFNEGLWFTGMNYPFGDLALFSDNQPLFSVPLAWVHRHIWPIAAYVTALQNVFLFIAIGIGGWCMQRILVRLYLPPWYSVLSAAIIVLMSPQHTQLDFQYALSYSFALVLPWLLLLKYFEEKGSWKWWSVYVLVSLALGFIHVYYLAINGLFGLGVALVYALQEKQYKLTAKLALGALLPSALFFIFLAMADSVPDRPQHPEGFFVHRANLEGIFWPYAQYYLPALQKIFPTLIDSRQVSYAFIGVAGSVCVLYFLVKGARYLMRRKLVLVVRPVLPGPLRYSVWAAVGVLLFGMAIPLKYGLEELVYQSPFLEQFRILYRFAWMFYYIYATVFAYFVYALFRKVRRRRPGLALIVLGLFLTLWVIDAVFFLRTEWRHLQDFPVGYSFNGRDSNLTSVFKKEGYPVETFQALIPLPYFNIGSEKIDVGYGYRSLYEGMRVSLHTGLPFATMMMARTSLSQALSQAQLLSSDLIEKTLLPYLPNQKPFLVMASKEKLGSLEEDLRRKATFLFEIDSLFFYELPVSSLRQDGKEKAVQAFLHDSATLIKKDGLYINKTRQVSWRQLGSSRAGGVFGQGEARVPEGPLLLYEGAVPGVADSSWTASVWINAASDRQLPNLFCQQADKHGKVLKKQKVLGNASFEIYGTWIKIDVTFAPQPAGSDVKIWLEGQDIWASSFLLKPASADVYQVLPSGAILYNNYIIREV